MQKHVGPYEVIRRLGAGGMGEVLAVRDSRLDREMAAKVLLRPEDQEARSRFVDEARITGTLEHPSIVPIHELGQTDTGAPFFTMKLVAGEDLAALIARVAGGDAVPIVDRLRIFVKICEAMELAHHNAVIHRDLKPANVMVGRFGEVQVMDWGLAKRLGGPQRVASAPRLELTNERDVGRTMEGAIVGTPAYMPPEQAEGLVDLLDERSDIYSLGAMLYELLTLRPPFAGATPWAVITAVLTEPLAPPTARAPDVPWELDAVVMRAMARPAGERYPTVRALRDDVTSFLEGRMLSAARYGPRQRLARWARAQRIGLSAALVTLVLAATLVIRHETGRRRAAATLARDRTEAALVLLAQVPPPARVAEWEARREAQLAEAGISQRDPALAEAWQTALVACRRADAALVLTGDEGRRRALSALSGRIALVAGDVALARSMFGRLPPAEARVELERIDRAEETTARWRLARVDAILSDIGADLARRQRPRGAATLAEYIYEVVGYGDSAIVARLGAALAEIPGARPTPAQTATAKLCIRVLSGWKTEDGIGAVGGWLAGVSDTSLLAEAIDALWRVGTDRARAVVVATRRRIGPDAPIWGHLAAPERDAIEAAVR